MAIGWLSILKAVPWTDVVSNAPKVADGAKKLWEKVAKKSPGSTEAASDNSATLSPEGQSQAHLESRIAKLTGEVSQLQKEMIDSTQLIKALADQNTQLIRRVYWLSRGLLVVGIAAVTGLALLLLR
ncbi:MAG: hypothetical protein Q8S26_02805 [Azonexus sp.]|nr:hypothetical protein [Azonexus sp.]